MTILKCSAMTCVYNKEQLCSKGDIDVTGENATSANETSCGSFRERTGSSMKDSYTDDCGCDKIQIDCKAHNCTYNDNCKCTASSIQVDGSNAHASSDTSCDTFPCHCVAEYQHHGNRIFTRISGIMNFPDLVKKRDMSIYMEYVSFVCL